MEKARQDSCSFRVFGDISDPDRISALLGVKPTYTHRKGERRSKFTEPYSNDMRYQEMTKRHWANFCDRLAECFLKRLSRLKA